LLGISVETDIIPVNEKLRRDGCELFFLQHHVALRRVSRDAAECDQHQVYGRQTTEDYWQRDVTVKVTVFWWWTLEGRRSTAGPL